MEKTYVQCNLKPKKLSEKAEYIEEEVEELRKNYDKEVKKKIRESQRIGMKTTLSHKTNQFNSLDKLGTSISNLS
jgi:hypothetical protein